MAAANFGSVALPFTLRYEGGRADDPRDPGGRTDRGVTQATFTAYLAKAGQPARDVFTITDAELEAIYRGGYWAAVKGDALPDGVDLAMFDFAVNSGPARALKAYAGRTSNDAAATVRAVCGARLSSLRGLRSFATFGRGWTARVTACEALALRMAEHARIGVPVAAAPTAGTAAKLLVESHRAAAQGARSRRRVVAAGAASAAGVTGAGAGAGGGAGTSLLAALALLAAAAAAWLWWRVHVERHRAAALAAAATPAADRATSPTPGALATP